LLLTIGVLAMTTSPSTTLASVATACLLLLAANVFGQADLVKTEGIISPVHQANVGKIVFTAKPVPIERLKDTDFLKTFELKETGDLAISALMGNSLTNYLHRLAPELSVDELTRGGNYQVSFLVDGVLIQKDDLHPATIPAGNKNTKTVFGLTF